MPLATWNREVNAWPVPVFEAHTYFQPKCLENISTVKFCVLFRRRLAPYKLLNLNVRCEDIPHPCNFAQWHWLLYICRLFLRSFRDNRMKEGSDLSSQCNRSDHSIQPGKKKRTHTVTVLVRKINVMKIGETSKCLSFTVATCSRGIMNTILKTQVRRFI